MIRAIDKKSQLITIQKIFVVGSGLMGSGIAQVFAQVGMTVMLNDENREALQKAEEGIAWSVGKLFEKGRIEEEKETILGRKVKAGHLGRKSGKGWYRYDKNGKRL